MAESKLIIQPGVNSVATETLNTAGWSVSNLVRFFEGFIQRLYGWTKWNPTAVIGIARAMHTWQDLDGNKYLMVGTNSRLQLYVGGQQLDITPIASTASLTNKFSTTINTTVVNVNDAAHGAVVGDWVYLEIPLGIGGIVLWQYYEVQTVVGVDDYTIASATAATSTATNAGDTPVFTTTAASAVVTVTLVNHGYIVGQVFTVQVSTAVSTLTIDGEYLVQTLVDADNFTITAGGAAAGNASASENADAEIVDYLLASGPVSSYPLTGWGAGTWGSGAWGASTGTAAIALLRIWSLDNFGENGLAVPTDGALYEWVPPASFGNVATVIATAPSKSRGMFVSMPQEIVVCWGTDVSGTQDPLLIRWSDAGDDTDWTASATNQAGSYRLSQGSAIVGAYQGPISMLFWTDQDLWIGNYQALPYVFSFQTIAHNCGLIAQNAFASIDKIVYWMSLKGFFRFDGSNVTPIPCPVWDNVFGALDMDYQDKIDAGGDTPFGEVFWFFPSTDGDGEVDSYVKLNVRDGLWDYGPLTTLLVRTAWIDQSGFGMPLSVDLDGFVMQQETGYDADGGEMTGATAQSGYADIADGQDFPFVDRIIPDIKWVGDDSDLSLTLTIYGKNYPSDTVSTYGPFTVTPSTQYITVRIRKRQLALKYDWNGTGGFARISGATRIRIAPSGRR